MSAHQVITGALNWGENVFSVGSVDGVCFTVCAVGTDVVILSASFERVQVIPGPVGDTKQVVTCVNCCQESGKIAATYGNVIRLFEPVSYTDERSKRKLSYRWYETQSLTLSSAAGPVLWNLDGLRLLVSCENRLMLYQHRQFNLEAASASASQPSVMFTLSEEEQEEPLQALHDSSAPTWMCVWSTSLAAPPKFMRFSPDGVLFATCGVNDRMVKIWYEERDPEAKSRTVQFNFTYVQHPLPVTGFEWRKVSRCMARGSVQNVLLTWCEDNTARMWKEALMLDESVHLSSDVPYSVLVDSALHKRIHHRHYRMQSARMKIMSRLQNLVMLKKKRLEELTEPSMQCCQRAQSASVLEAVAVSPATSLVHFHLAGSINAENDCLLVPSMDNVLINRKSFAVHWLNNKELVFSIGAEKIIAELLEKDPTEVDHLLAELSSLKRAIAQGDLSSLESATELQQPSSPVDGAGESSSTIGTPSVALESPLTANETSSESNSFSEKIPPKDSLDLKLEELMKQWIKSSDILFAIHPVDGSLLCWTVEWLDELCRQPVISFTSRFPFAFPITDAASLNPYLSTFNPEDPVYIDSLQHYLLSDSQEEASTYAGSRCTVHRSKNVLYLLTSHENGSLNLWHFSMEDNSNFTQILNIAHSSRMCGHRFPISKVIPHPMLPLMLTSSHFNNSEERLCEDGRSELILWRINPVGPLCKSGGIRELSRMTSSSSKSFSSIAWIPAILPSCTLGSVCNSPSSCFVASDGVGLVVYQAVVDAAGLLAEIYACETREGMQSESSSTVNDDSSSDFVDAAHRKRSLKETFNVVSTQSTAKPGCVLRLTDVVDAEHDVDGLLCLHVFNEHLVLSSSDQEMTSISDERSAAVIDRSRSPVFSDRYFIVLVERVRHADRLRMWSLTISSQHPLPIKSYDHDDGEARADRSAPGPFYRPASPVAPSAAQLVIHSEKVCDQTLPLPDGVNLISVVATAGHLPSSNLYPACKAPYVLLSACSDEHVRFWNCVKMEQPNGQCTYSWRNWGMVSDTDESDLEVEGEVYSVSSAHSGRFACAYMPEGVVGTKAATARNIKVGVFECESSGGVEWLREDTLIIDNQPFVSKRRCVLNGPQQADLPNRVTPTEAVPPTEEMRKVLSDKALQAKKILDTMDVSDLVRIDWVSTEDGSHILTVGLGSSVYMYTQVSQGAAQRNIVMMKEHETHRRPPLRKASSLANPERISTRLVRWLCIRYLELHSADGLPPLPTTLNWVRDGLLIVGMHSEMRCYNQWNLVTKVDTESLETDEKGHPLKRKLTGNQLASLNISPSHSMLYQLSKKTKMDAASSKQKMFKDMMHRVISAPRELQELFLKDEHVLEAVSDEGLFEAARLASPILPQYHPKQLIELLNAGKTRKVKAILLHVLNCLKQSNVSMPNPLSRAASIRRMSVSEPMDGAVVPAASQTVDATRMLSETFDDANPEYDELDSIAPLPLYLLMSADQETCSEEGEKAANIDGAQNQYSSLFEAEEEQDDLEEVLEDDSERRPTISRRASISAEQLAQSDRVPTVFTARHSRMLTDFLTHTHLPGLSSVDQMHLLAVADTLSHFSADAMDKLAQANAAFQTVQQSVVSDAASGYATATAGSETVDECGLRFLMAMKQHEYLLLCLPLKQKQLLRQRGLSSSNIIWALHSETENELLNAIPCLHKSQPNWDELRSLGVGWWLKNTASLRNVVEKLAKAAFQLRQDPMDASLYYLAMRKKNVLTHLFKTIKEQKMADFFSQDFNEERWKKAALKNAFVLMGKQRFQHAAAFFLLAGSLKDALQAVLSKLHDMQLAMVIVRLYESEHERQWSLMRELLCREILGVEPEELDGSSRCEFGSDEDLVLDSPHASQDPFERSMAFWHLKEYSRAALTLVQEGSRTRFEAPSTDCSLSDIFNFYSFLRNHPLVVRQRLSDAGIQMGSTEKFLAIARQLSEMVTPSERRLYFRTASAHMASGCPLLALDVLMRLPRNVSMVVPGPSMLGNLLNGRQDTMSAISSKLENEHANALDWSMPTNVIQNEELKLEWSDDEENASVDGSLHDEVNDRAAVDGHLSNNAAILPNSTELPVAPNRVLDVISQQMKFIASLRTMMEEISTLASGFEVDGGQLRFQLFKWLEKEVEVLKKICEYQSTSEDIGLSEDVNDPEEPLADLSGCVPALHEALRTDRLELACRIRSTVRRRKWLRCNQKLLRSFTSYCALHSAQNYRLTSALMELLLLLQEIQQDSGAFAHLNELPVVHSFPLLAASVSSCKMFVSSPLHFIENQCSDLLLTIAEISAPPTIDSSLAKVYKLYNLCQGLSSCLYQSLCDVENLYASCFNQQQAGVLTRRPRCISQSEDIRVTTIPSKWPGVDNLVALLSREKDEEAPQLRLLLSEIFVAVTMSLFAYAFTAYDSRWLYRLAAHVVDVKQFANVFGGGGEKKLRTAPPVRPPRPSTPRKSSVSSTQSSGSTTGAQQTQANLSIDSSAFRAKFHAKVFGTESPLNAASLPAGAQRAALPTPPPSEQIVYRWVPPTKNIVQMFAEKPEVRSKEELGVEYDSDEEPPEGDEDEEDENDEKEEKETREHNNPDGFAWLLMRVALIHQQIFRLKQFIVLAGFDPNDLPAIAPRIDAIFKLLDLWAVQLSEAVINFPDGCPPDIIPNMNVDNTESHLGPSLRKYRNLLEPGNTPFESDDPAALPVRRLWAYLVRQDHLTRTFIRHIFGQKGQQGSVDERVKANGTAASGVEQPLQPEAFKIIQREHEPIAAFACCQVNVGRIVVSSTRELQEMDVSPLLEEIKNQNSQSWLNNRTELDIALCDAKKEPLKDNDDYQLLIDNGRKTTAANFLLKRQVNGIRRMDSHPLLPYYVSGSADGSIRLWEWGVGQPLFTPRVAGQYAKVTKVVFSANGNKFAAVDGDGLLSLWQASQGLPIRNPFFNQKCHSKSAADVRFLGSTSSVLVTAGYGSGDQNLAMWDTLMPQSKAMVHMWCTHPEGATSVMYIPADQTIVSGGRHGEICLWDVRQRLLRATVKCFENSTVKCLAGDSLQESFVAGSSDGDIKIWSGGALPQVQVTLIGEHAARGGFSLRQVGSGGVQGVQQLFVDSQMRLFSCGADCSLKLRMLTSSLRTPSF